MQPTHRTLVTDPARLCGCTTGNTSCAEWTSEGSEALKQRLDRFTEIVSQPEDSINLAAAALEIAADEYPDLNINHYLRLLDTMAEEVRERVDSTGEPRAKIQALNEYLFGELRFHGNTEFYYDPRNSYLNDVIDRRVGLPITLSVVYIEVGRRLGLPLYGVGLPGHFICKWQDADNEIFVDPFHNGEILDEEGLLQLVQDTYDARVQLHREWVQPVGPRYILIRILNNLRGIFLQKDDSERALAVLEKLLVLEPYSEENLREAGLLSYRIGALHRAAEFWEEYLLRHPETGDAVHVRTYLRTVWVAINRLN